MERFQASSSFAARTPTSIQANMYNPYASGAATASTASSTDPVLRALGSFNRLFEATLTRQASLLPQGLLPSQAVYTPAPQITSTTTYNQTPSRSPRLDLSSLQSALQQLIAALGTPSSAPPHSGATPPQQTQTLHLEGGESRDLSASSYTRFNLSEGEGLNTFTLGGSNNDFVVSEVGSNERINLKGQGWQLIDDGNAEDGIVRYANSLTGSSAELRVMEGNSVNEARAKSQVRFVA